MHAKHTCTHTHACMHAHTGRLYSLEGIFYSEGDRSMEWAARGSCNSKNIEQFEEFVR